MSKRLAKFLLLLPGIGYILVFLAVIFGFTVAQSFGYFNFTGESGFTTAHWAALWGQQLWDSLLYSLKVGLVSSFGSLILTYLMTFVLRGSYCRRTFLSFFKIPIFIPALVGSFLIINLFDYSGIVNFCLMKLGLIAEPIKFRDGKSMGMVYVVQIWKNMPFQLLILYPAIDGVRRDIVEASRNLGASGIRSFFEVTFPLTVSTSIIAVILVFIGTFGDFSVSATAGPRYPFSVSRLMYYSAYSRYDWGLAACIALTMILLITVLVSVYTYIQRRFV